MWGIQRAWSNQVCSYQQQRYIDILYLRFYVLVLLSRVYASRVLNYKLPAFLSVPFLSLTLFSPSMYFILFVWIVLSILSTFCNLLMSTPSCKIYNIPNCNTFVFFFYDETL